MLIMSLALCLTENIAIATLSTWHVRFAHVYGREVNWMASGIGVSGMIISPGGLKIYVSCHGYLCNLANAQAAVLS